MKKFKTPKKQQQQHNAVSSVQSSSQNSAEQSKPGQSLLEKELIKQVTKAGTLGTNVVKTSTANNSNQSSVIVNYENRKHLSGQQLSPQNQHSLQQHFSQNSSESLPSAVTEADHVKQEDISSRGVNVDGSHGRTFESVNHGDMSDRTMVGEAVADHVKLELDSEGKHIVYGQEEYENAKYAYNGTGHTEDGGRVDQNSPSPIMLTTMQPVPIDHSGVMTEQSIHHPSSPSNHNHPEQMEQHPSMQDQQQFLTDSQGRQVQQFVEKHDYDDKNQMIIGGNHPDDGQLYQNMHDNVHPAFNANDGHLANDIVNGTLLNRQTTRETGQIIRNTTSLGGLPPMNDPLSQEETKGDLHKRLLGNVDDLLPPTNNHMLHGGNSGVNDSLSDGLSDPSDLSQHPQKTVIYLQSTTNENGQQTFIYDPSLQTQHIPTEIVGGLLQNSGLVAGGNGLLNLQDGNGGTTVLVLQEMPPGGECTGVATSDGTLSGGVGCMTTGGSSMGTTGLIDSTGAMATLSNAAALATKIPTTIIRKRKDHSSGVARDNSASAGPGRSMSDLSDTPGPPVSQGGSTSTSAADDPGWRAYYEQVQHQHPLAAATSAMLNINGEEGQSQGGPAVSASSGMPPLIYEYYKIPQLAASGGQDKDVWPSTSLNQSVLTSGSLSTSSLLSTSKLSTNQTLLSSLDSAPLHHAPPSLHASQLGDLQSLLYSGAPSGSLLHSGSIVKREPEDLSHRNSRASPTMTDCKKSKIVLVGGQGQQQDGLVIDVVNNNNNTIKDEFSPHNRNGGTTPSSICSDHTLNSAPSGTHPHHMELINTDNIKHTSLYSSMSGSPPMSQYNIEYTTATSTAGQFTPAALTNSSSQLRTLSAAGDSQYYREYFNSTPSSDYATNQVRPGGSYVGDMESSLMERYVRSQQGAAGPTGAVYHTKSVISASGLTVDLPSPDSGIGADTITPRDPTAIHQSFDYSDMCSPANLMGGSGSQDGRVGVAGSPGSNASATNRSRPWHDFGRQNDADKIQIPKLYSPYGFKFVLETPISTNQRREDDRVTYINKGQFYGITMEYIPDPDKPLKSSTVKSIVMLMFREEKSPEDEIKAWQFWHSRQHSVKQRILDADTKNSVGLVGCIEEISHNAIAVYWNPLESPAKINIAVQCLSTDFSSQKGVKGLPLHVQIDTYDDPRDGPVLHRGYVQLKVFCDKGAERKTRDEERRAAKRKMTATGRKKMDELYHPPCERSEFYTMADTNKPPVLFSPAEDIDKIASMELGFYGHEDTSSLSNGETGGSIKHGGQGGGSPFLIHSKPPGTPTPPTLKFHNHFPPDSHSDKKELDQVSMTTDGNVFSSLPLKRPKLMPPLNERVMLYVRQEADEIYTPLHVSPPSTQGLLNALELKYNINATNICNLLRKNLKGIIVKIDDDMLKYYCNEDLFLLEVEPATDKPDSDLINIILCEIDS